MVQATIYKLLLFAWITAQKQLIHDLTASRTEWKQRYDFIVVGAGSAGCVVANRLTDDKNINVLLLEAGESQSAVYNDIPGMWSYITSTQHNFWNYYNEPQQFVGKQYPGGRIPEPLGRTLGGSSAINVMLYNRGNRRDFDNWAERYGAKGWSYKEVLPYFIKLENNTNEKIVRENPGFHGTSGPVQISSPTNPSKILLKLSNALNELKFRETDINGANQSGYMIGQSTITRNGLRAGTGNAYVDPNPHPKNLHILTKALVVKILFNSSTAIGVEFTKNNKSYRVFANKEVIISAGPINSPQLLMLSGVGPRLNLENLKIPVIQDLPVGKNYVTNPVIHLFVPVNQSLTLPVPQLSEEQLSQLYFGKSGPLSEVAENILYFSTKMNKDKEWPNVQVTSYATNATLGMLMELVRTRSRGTIRLQSTNPLDPPLIDPNFLTDPLDYEDFVDGIKTVFNILENTSLSQYVDLAAFNQLDCPVCSNRFIYECTEGINCLIKHFTSTIFHIGGSCRMGSTDRSDVVVDPLLRVKNVVNLRVCDSSVFPELPNAHTNAASIMTGEKCSQIVKQFYHLL